MIAKVFNVRKTDMKVMFGIMGGAYIFGLLLFGFVMLISKDEDTTFEMATTMMTFCILMFSIFIEAMGFQVEYNMAIGMGVTRKKFIPAYYVVSLIFLVIEIILVYIGHFIESAIIKTFYSGYEHEKGIELFLFSGYVIPAIILVAAFGMFAGALVLKFGKKALWGFWVIWMVGCMLPGRVSEAVEKGHDGILAQLGSTFKNVISGITFTNGLLIIILASVVCMLSAYGMLHKQRVTEM